MNQRWRQIALWVLPIGVALLLGWQVPDRFRMDLLESGSSPDLVRLLRWALRWISVPVISLGLLISIIDLAKSWSGAGA